MWFNKLFNHALLLALAAAAAREDECSDLSSPQCCYEASVAWASSKSLFEEYTFTVVHYSHSYIQDTYTDVPTTTLCDGFLRYLGPRSGEVSTITVSPVDKPITSAFNTPYPTPAPSCTINEEDCVADMRPHCTTYYPCPPDPDAICMMHQEGGAKVYYWPATVEGDLCGERTTITHPEPTRSTVISGSTFVSPSVYLSMDRLDAWKHDTRYIRRPCGRDKFNLMLTLDPSDVSTSVGSGTFRQLNLADLNDPTPVTAYFGLQEAPDCEATPENCTSSIEVTHTPAMSAPVQMFRDLDIDYEFCDFHPDERNEIWPITWIPLEPTQDSWPEPTSGSEGEKEDDEEEEDDKEEEDG